MAGTVIWHELYTSDVGAATRFYAELLGAEIEVAQMPDMEYPMLKKGGHNHAGFFLKDSEHERVPSHWYPYFEVDDVDAASERAKSLGSDVFHGPASVEEAEIRLAVLGDPQHATFGVLTSPNPAPTGLFVWDELHAPDVEAAKRYYGELLGWTTSSFREGYDVFSAGERMVGGLMAKNDGTPGSSWISYLAVDDADAATAKARELGASVLLEPTTMENVGRYSVLADPTDAVIGLHKSAN
jgi:predicted enzyme related to lactoylglutathione lyase